MSGLPPPIVPHRTCPACGSPNSDKAVFCYRCGARIAYSPAPSILAVLGAVTLALLAVPLGVAGLCGIMGATVIGGGGGLIALSLGSLLLAVLAVVGAVRLLR